MGKGGKNVLAGNVEKSVCRFHSIQHFADALQYVLRGVRHLNRPSQVLHSAMPTAPEVRGYSDCRWMKSDRITLKLSFISKGRE